MKICPICALVAGSWIGLLAYRTLGGAVDPALIATLMGGSAVGISYTYGRRLWLILPLLAVAYGIAAERWYLALVSVLIAGIVLLAYAIRSRSVSTRIVSDAEKKLAQCC